MAPKIKYPQFLNIHILNLHRLSVDHVEQCAWLSKV